MKLFKKITAMTLSLIMCLSMAAFTVSADGVDEPTVTENILLNEDFSTYTNKEFLDPTGSASGSVAGHVWSAQNDWFINVHTRGDKLGSDGSSMLLNDGMMTVTYNNIGGSVAWYNPIITRKVDISENAVGSAMVLPTEGELVVSAKVKVDANTTSADFSSSFILLGIAGDDALETGSSGTGILNSNKLYHSLKLDASGNIIPANFTADGFSFARDKWYTVTFTYDLAQTSDKYACDITVVSDDATVNSSFTNVALNSSAGKLDSIYGLTVQLGVNNATNKTGNGKVYYDDFGVKTVKVEYPEDPEPTVPMVTLLNDDFSGYNSVNLLNTSDSTTANSWTGVQTSKWLVNVWDRCDKTGSTGSSALLNDDMMTITYNNLGGRVRYNNPIVTRKVDETSSTVGEAVTLPTEGSLVVSAKVKVDANATSADFSGNFRLLSVVGDDAITTGSVTNDSWSGIANNDALYHSLKLDASGNIIPANFTADGFSFARDKWHTITFTYDLTQTTAQYVCDITVTTEGVTDAAVFEDVALTGSSAGKLDSIYGISVGLGVNNATATTLGNGTVYYDDFKVQISEHIKADAVGEFVSGTGYVADISVTAVANSAKDVWCVVAAYGENNKLIDAKIADFGSVSANTPVSIEDITLANATAENTEKVCVLVWDGSDTMVPYSQPVIIYPVAE